VPLGIVQQKIHLFKLSKALESTLQIKVKKKLSWPFEAPSQNWNSNFVRYFEKSG
jgi:hypothetical protein